MQIFRGALPDSGSPPHGMRKLRSMMPLPSRAAFKKVFDWLHNVHLSEVNALQRKSHFFFWELHRLSPNFHIHVSVSDKYIPRIGPHISCSGIGRLILVMRCGMAQLGCGMAQQGAA
jgi:hypothetical protein